MGFKPVVLAGLMFSSMVAMADPKEITIKVKGMVCSFCAQGITKKFKQESSIDTIDVKLKDQRVTLKTKEGQDLTDTKIREIFSDSGYNVDSIERK